MPPSDAPVINPLPKLLDKLRVEHYSIRTEHVYVDWIKRFILFHGKRHPQEMGAPELEVFRTDLAVRSGVSVATQNRALSALLFLCKQMLEVALPWLDNVERAQAPRRLPVVLTREEASKALASLEGAHRLVGSLPGQGFPSKSVIAIC